MNSVKENNRKIAEFMGFTHYHPGIDIDDGTVGGIYNRFEIFSKIPILAEEYPEDDQYYFSNIPNPDYGKPGKTQWRNDLRTIPWDAMNDEYIYDVRYHEKWGWLMPVAQKIKDMMIDQDYEPSIHAYSDMFKAINELECALMNVEFKEIYKSIILFIDAYEYKKRCYSEDVNYKELVLCAQKGCPEESNEYSKYCKECYDEKYPDTKK